MLSPEPNSKMDELLKAYAKKRREQAEPSAQMHPATRKLLQDEVKRTLGAPLLPPRQNWQKWRWPLLAFGGGFAALLVMFAVINAQMRQLLPATAPADRSLSAAHPILKAPELDVAKTPSRPAILAATDKKTSDSRDQTAPPIAAAGSINTSAAAAAATPRTDLAEAGQPPAANSKGSQALAPPETQAAPSSQPAGAVSLNETRLGAGAPSVLADKSASVSPEAVAPVNPPIAAAAPPAVSAAVAKEENTPRTAPAGAASDASYVAAGEFVQTQNLAREKAAQPSMSNVLSAFQLQRSGQNVRVLDADGSVYEGQVLDGISSATAMGGAGRRARYGSPRQSRDTNDGTNWTFKVTGTNQHLQQNVVFTGNVLTMPAANSLNAAAGQNRSASQPQMAPASAPVSPAQNSRITGQVQVGGGREIPIEAKPPNP